MSDKPTPRPWRYQNRNGVAEVHAPDGTTIFEDAGGSVGHANARLIAAAPETAAERDRLRESNAELVEALEEAVRVLEECYQRSEVDREEYKLARAALAGNSEVKT